MRRRFGTAMLALAILLTMAGGAQAAPRRPPPIVGGHPATAAVAGSVAVVEYDGQTYGFSCTGTLIATNWILTAGHCATDDVTGVALDPGGFRVAVGNAQFSSLHFLTVDQVVPDPLYSVQGYDWDVSLLHLAGSGSAAPTVDLLDPADASLGATGASATAIGWGLTSGTATVLPDQLYETGMTVSNGSICTSAFGPWVFSANQVCAVANPGTTCDGDSGGPLLVFSPNGLPFIDGVANYGAAQCPIAAPAGFASVLAVRDWIISTAGLSAPGLLSATPTLGETTATFALMVDNHGADSDVSLSYIPPGGGTVRTPDTVVSGAGARGVSFQITGLQAGTVYHGTVDIQSSYGATTHPITFRTVDHTAPTLQLIAARGRPGKLARLKYRVADNSFQSRVSITVFRGNRRVFSSAYWLPGLSPMTWTEGFKIPRRRGSFHWCAQASDHDHNVSRQLCEPIKVKWP
jgi:hypothetical protein